MDFDAPIPPVLAVGCPMWAHRPWVRRWFGPTPNGQELVAYSRWCSAVEGNTTFYALPAPASVARWAEQAPPGFRFCFKVPQGISHQKRLRNCGDDLVAFTDRLAPLASRLGPISLQLPASFAPTALDVLDRFLADVPREANGDALRWAVEVRHRDFEAEGLAENAINDLLAARDVDRTLIDTRALFSGPRETPAEIEAWDRKPRLRVRPVATGPMPVVRFVGQRDPDANRQFWQPWVDVVARWLQRGATPTFFVHTPDNEWSPELARLFHAEVAAVVPDLAALPDTAESPAQPALFPD